MGKRSLHTDDLPVSVTPTGDGQTAPVITPTDISQYIRLDQCPRFLRLQLHTRNGGSDFWRAHSIQPQPIPPLLAQAGAEFEQEIEGALGIQYPYSHYGSRLPNRRHRLPDNDRVLQEIRNLKTGAVHILLQPRLSVEAAGWRLRGDMDIVRVERAADGKFHILIVDIKRSASAKNEHRLQLAFYHQIVATLLVNSAIQPFEITTGVLYRGVEEEEVALLSEAEQEKRELQRQAAQEYFGEASGLLELTDDPEAFLAEVESLVLSPECRAVRIAAQPFEDVPFHLAPKCDGCYFNEFCLKWAAQHDDLSLIPHLNASEKGALLRGGVKEIKQLAALKVLQAKPGANNTSDIRGTSDASTGEAELLTPPENVRTVQKLSATWPVGPRLDELIHRARRYRRFKSDDIAYLPYIPPPKATAHCPTAMPSTTRTWYVSTSTRSTIISMTGCTCWAL